MTLCPYCYSGFSFEEIPMTKFKIIEKGPNQNPYPNSVRYKCKKCKFAELYSDNF